MKLASLNQPCKEIKSIIVKRTFARSYTQRQDRVLRSARGQGAGTEPRVGFASMDKYSYHGLQESERESSFSRELGHSIIRLVKTHTQGGTSARINLNTPLCRGTRSSASELGPHQASTCSGLYGRHSGPWLHSDSAFFSLPLIPGQAKEGENKQLERKSQESVWHPESHLPRFCH